MLLMNATTLGFLDLDLDWAMAGVTARRVRAGYDAVACNAPWIGLTRLTWWQDLDSAPTAVPCTGSSPTEERPSPKRSRATSLFWLKGRARMHGILAFWLTCS